jgi:hypothetical protein
MDFSEKMKKDGNSAPIADRSRNGSGMLPRSPRSIDGAGARKKVFSTPKYWNYSDGNINDMSVPAVASTSVRFDYPRVFNNSSTGYQPKHLDLWTKQNVGPIPVQAINQRDTIPIYMDVSFDGDYHVKDTLFIVLQPR